jgi:hypothetical protein
MGTRIFLKSEIGQWPISLKKKKRRVHMPITNNLQELESDIMSDLAGHFRDVALALLQTPQDFVADNIHMNLKV